MEVADLVGFDAVIHLAALSNDPLGDISPGITYDINHHGSVRLARVAKEAGVPRFLFSSSCSLYGASAGDEMIDEKAAFNPVTPYGESKIWAERDLQLARRRQFLAHLPAQCDCLRLLASTARRRRGEQPRRPRGHDARCAPPDRRKPVAAAHPRRGYLPRLRRRSGGSTRGRSQRGVQRGQHRRELSDPGCRGHRTGRRSRQPRGSFRQGWTGPSKLSSELRQVCSNAWVSRRNGRSSLAPERYLRRSSVTA